MLYFAYGSNMDWDQMKNRCPSTQFVGLAVLRDYQLAFTRKSKKRNCGVADVVPASGKEVWGVVYEITDGDRANLDECEGYREGRDTNSYWRKECTVHLVDDHKDVKVWTYFAEPQQNPPLPNSEYKNLLLSGARYWNLPALYRKELESIKVSS